MNLGLLHPPMGSKQVDLSAYKAIGFDRGASVFKEGLWLLVSLLLFRLCPLKLFALKRLMLECFGAKVGKGVVIKPGARITCISCHEMHGGDPRGQLTDEKKTNAACNQCHPKIIVFGAIARAEASRKRDHQ